MVGAPFTFLSRRLKKKGCRLLGEGEGEERGGNTMSKDEMETKRKKGKG